MANDYIQLRKQLEYWRHKEFTKSAIASIGALFDNYIDPCDRYHTPNLAQVIQQLCKPDIQSKLLFFPSGIFTPGYKYVSMVGECLHFRVVKNVDTSLVIQTLIELIFNKVSTRNRDSIGRTITVYPKLFDSILMRWSNNTDQILTTDMLELLLNKDLFPVPNSETGASTNPPNFVIVNKSNEVQLDLFSQ